MKALFWIVTGVVAVEALYEYSASAALIAIAVYLTYALNDTFG